MRVDHTVTGETLNSKPSSILRDRNRNRNRNTNMNRNSNSNSNMNRNRNSNSNSNRNRNSNRNSNSNTKRNSSQKSTAMMSSTAGRTTLSTSRTNRQIDDHDKNAARVVRRLKMAILTFFTLTAAGVTTAFFVYRYYNKQAQERDFKNQFQQDADNMLASLGISIDHTLGAVDAFAISMLAEAKVTNQTYPFVSINDWAVQSGKLLKNSRAKFITTYQVVEESQRTEWEEYASMHNGWVEDSIDVQSRDRSYKGPNITDQYVEENYIGHYDLIHGYDEHVFGWENNTGGVSHEGPYLPLWQQTPVIPIYPLYNWCVGVGVGVRASTFVWSYCHIVILSLCLCLCVFVFVVGDVIVYSLCVCVRFYYATRSFNTFIIILTVMIYYALLHHSTQCNGTNRDLSTAAFRDPWYAVVETHLVTITEPYMIAWPWDTEKQEENFSEAEWLVYLLEPGEEPLEPISDIYYPVIVEALDNVHHREEDLSSENYSTAPQSNKLGAVLALTIYWRDALRDLLPMGSAGVVVAFENACDVPSFTYEIAGPVPRYLGTGKYNSTFENDNELSRVLNLMDVWQFGIKETAYTGIPINEDVCPFLLRVYPTESSREQFIDGDDKTVYIVLALVLSVAVVTIAFTLLFFFLYDRLVRNEIRAKINLLDAKRNFVRFVSHEVRTPLNTVSMGLTLIHQDLLSRERQIGNENESDTANNDKGTFVSKEDFSKWSSLTGDVSKNADIAVGVLNDLLNIDKIQMGAFRLEMETLPVWDLIEQTTMEFNMMATKQKTKLNLDLKSLVKSQDVETVIPTTASMLPPLVLNKKIVGDPQRIRQVLRNLLSNAIKFSKNQSVTLKVSTRDATTTSNDAQAMKEFNLTGGSRVGLSMSGWVVVDVIDTGVGMTPLQLQTVFDVGTQFNANKLQSGGGSGLGLAFAKAIAEQHGGSLRAYSSGRDKGTTFRLDLPLYHDEAMESTSSNNKNDDANADATLSLSSSVTSAKPGTTTTTIRGETLEPIHILVVDDALLNRKLLIRLLESNGHSCGEAENGQELIDTIEARCNSSSEEAQAAQYDCILVDYEMPVMNGPDACKAIREMGYTGFVVGVTGNLLPEDVGYFMDCGADAVLSKPFKYKDLEQLLMEQGIFAV